MSEEVIFYNRKEEDLFAQVNGHLRPIKEKQGSPKTHGCLLVGVPSLTLQSILRSPCYFNLNSSRTHVHLEPQIAQDLFNKYPGQVDVEIEANREDIGLEELDRQQWGCVRVTIRQLVEQGRHLRKAVFMHKYPVN